jgi:hypothetical protein
MSNNIILALFLLVFGVIVAFSIGLHLLEKKLTTLAENLEWRIMKLEDTLEEVSKEVDDYTHKQDVLNFDVLSLQNEFKSHTDGTGLGGDLNIKDSNKEDEE